MRLILIITLVLYTTRALNVALTKSSQTCFIVSQGRYQLQYVVSGNDQNNARCVVSQNQRVILQVSGKSEFEGQFEITQNRGSICFSSMSSHTKSVSFDFIKVDDPLRGLINDRQKLAIHESLYQSYQQLQKVYRDQHFFLQRNYIHQILQRNTQISVVFFLLLKLMTMFVCGFLQLFYVKIILQTNYKPFALQQSA